MNLLLVKSKSAERGFSLLEVLVSIVIFIAGMLGVIALIGLSIANAAMIRNRLIAANLAQEGIEIIRNIRDGNFLASVSWDQGVSDDLTPGGSKNGRIAYDSQSVLSWNNQPLRFHPVTGLFDYNPSGAEESIFRRTINIQKISVDEIRITSTVTWEERGLTKSVEAQAHLFNWI